MKKRYIECRFVELNDATFFAGTNFIKKLDPKRYTGLVLNWDDEKKHLILKYKGRIGIFPNIHYFEPETPSDIIEGMETPVILTPVNTHVAQDINKFQGAQVE